MDPATSGGSGGVGVLETRATGSVTWSRRGRNAQRAWSRATRTKPTRDTAVAAGTGSRFGHTIEKKQMRIAGGSDGEG